MDRRYILKLLDDDKLSAQLELVDELIQKRIPGAFQGEMNPYFTAGKRLRPILTLVCARLNGAHADRKVIVAAAAVEMVHQASLLHDSLLDEDLSEARHARFLLAGDAWLACGLSTALEAAPAVAARLSQTVLTMAEGEILQLEASQQLDPQSNTYIEVVAQKTGALLAAAGWAGGLAVGLDPAKLDQLTTYGEQFGIAFQILDDLRDGDFSPKNRTPAEAAARLHIEAAADAIKPFGNKARQLNDLAFGYLERALANS